MVNNNNSQTELRISRRKFHISNIRRENIKWKRIPSKRTKKKRKKNECIYVLTHTHFITNTNHITIYDARVNMYKCYVSSSFSLHFFFFFILFLLSLRLHRIDAQRCFAFVCVAVIVLRLLVDIIRCTLKHKSNAAAVQVMYTCAIWRSKKQDKNRIYQNALSNFHLIQLKIKHFELNFCYKCHNIIHSCDLFCCC